MKAWWESLATRERQTLIFGGIALFVMGFYMLLWVPLQDGLSAAETKLAAAHKQLALMQSRAAEVQYLKTQNRPRGKTSNASPMVVIESTARGARLKEAMVRSEPAGKNGVKIKFEAVEFDRLLPWLQSLQQRNNLAVTSFKLDPSDKSGLVDVQLALERMK